MMTPLPKLLTPSQLATLKEALTVLQEIKDREPEQRGESFRMLHHAERAAEGLGQVLGRLHR